MRRPLLRVLLVEDDEVEVMSVRRAFRMTGVEHDLIVARDGVEALAVLRGVGHPKLARPYVILLDVNMPRMNGLEFLCEVRRDPELSAADVIVLTTSTAEADRRAACDARVAGYVVKSTLGEDFRVFASSIAGFLSLLAPGAEINAES
jgi:CheY-like chemotaxis protein